MAKRIKDEEMRYTLVVNDNKAQMKLFKLEKSTRNLKESNKALSAEKARLASQDKKNTVEYKRLTQQIKENNAQIKRNKTEMNKLQKELGLTGLTMAQLRKKARDLKNTLRNMVPGSAEYNKLQKELKQTQRRIDEVRFSAKRGKKSLSRLASGFNKYAAMGTAAIAALAGVVVSIQKVIDYNSKLSDAQADVRKTTGLTKKEVDELTKSFGAMKTRTTRIQLLKLAEEAGRLGITGVKHLQDFVKVSNKLKVALGDELSDEEIRQIGKITNLYGVGATTGRGFAEAMESVGSAINFVAQSGMSNSDFMVNYLQRQAGVATQAKISAAANIGYAATFDELGQRAETSATVMNKVMIDMFADTEFYAQIAGKSVDEFSKLLKTDANQAIILFLKSLNGSNGGLQEMAKKLKELQVGGARATGALAILAQNTDLLKKRQEQAAEAIEQNISLQQEYNIKNNNFAATLKKVQRRIKGVFMSDTVVNFLKGAVTWFAKFIGATEDATGGVTGFRNKLVVFIKVVLVAATAVLSYKAALKLTALWSKRATTATALHNLVLKVQNVVTRTVTSATLLYKAAMLALTGNIKRATAAMRLFGIVTKMNPIGLLVGIVTAAATAYLIFSNNIEKAKDEQFFFNKSLKKANESIAGQAAVIKSLQAVAEDETASEEARISAIKKLNEIVPHYNDNLDLTTKALKKGKTAIDAYVASLKKKAQAEFLSDKVSSLSKKLEETKNKSSSEFNSFWGNQWRVFKNRLVNFGLIDYKELGEDLIKNKTETVATLTKELEAAEAAFKKFLNDNSDSNGPNNKPKNGDTKYISGVLMVYRNGKWTPVKPTKNNSPTSNNVSEFKDFSKKLLQEQRELVDKQLAIKKAGFAKELALLNEHHKRELANIKAQKFTQIELNKVNEAIKAAKARGNTALVAKLQQQKQQMLAINKALDDQLIAQEEIYQQKKGKLVVEGYQKELQALNDNFKEEQRIRDANHKTALALLGNNSLAKKRLKERFNREDQEAQKKHLQDLIDFTSQMLTKGAFKGIDLDILNEDQLAAIKKRLASLGLSLGQVNAILSAMRSGGKSKEEKQNAGLDQQALNIDVLGFTVEDWMTTFEHLNTLEQKVKAVGMVMQGMMNVYKMYSQFRNAADQRDFKQFVAQNNRKREKQKRLLDAGLINRRQFDAAIAALDKKKEKKREKLQYEQAMRNWTYTLGSSISQGALAVAEALPNIPLSIIVGAIAAAQTAIVAAHKPVKGFEEGLYPIKREQDGKIFNAGYGGYSSTQMVDRPTVFLAGESGSTRPEMIISGKDYANFDPEFRNILHRQIASVRGYEDGYYSSNTNVGVSKSMSDDVYVLLSETKITLMNLNTTLNEINENGIPAYLIRNMENAKKIKSDIEEYETLRNSNRL